MSCLLIFAHRLYEHSTLHQLLIQQAENIKGVTLVDLYEEYPNFILDAQFERQRLRNFSRIILQFPLTWFAPPALLKEWFDVVFLKDFAFGENYALEGKSLQIITSYNSYHFRQNKSNETVEIPQAQGFLEPIKTTAAICKMTYQEPLIFDNASLKEPHARQNYLQQYIACLCRNEHQDLSISKREDPKPESPNEELIT